MSQPDIFQMEIDSENSRESLVPTSLFQEIEQELSQRLFNNKSEEDFTDGPLDFIENLVNNLQTEFGKILGESDDKNYLLGL